MASDVKPEVFWSAFPETQMGKHATEQEGPWGWGGGSDSHLAGPFKDGEAGKVRDTIKNMSGWESSK